MKEALSSPGPIPILNKGAPSGSSHSLSVRFQIQLFHITPNNASWMQLPPDQAVKSTVTAVWSGDGGDVGGGVGVCVCVCARVCMRMCLHTSILWERSPRCFYALNWILSRFQTGFLEAEQTDLDGIFSVWTQCPAVEKVAGTLFIYAMHHNLKSTVLIKSLLLGDLSCTKKTVACDF